jgi:CRISPR/Cas system-associated exonuclease Cas4 (RecB family)
MRACRLRAAFSHDRHAGERADSPAARLGVICHSVLESLVRSKGLTGSDWESRFDQVWESEVRKTAAQPDLWPDFQLKKARLRRLAKRLRGILSSLPEASEVLPELLLSGNEGKLQGRADLVIRGKGTHVVIDYKTGKVIDSQTQGIRDSYQWQLQLYAVLEQQTFGEWPESASLLPLEGPSVSVAIDPGACRRVADEAMRLLSDYNDVVPNPQPASASPRTCTVCPYAAGCAAFWSSCDTSWQPDCVAVAGHVTQVTSSPLGGISISVQVERGSVDAESVMVRNVDPLQHPAISRVSVGDEVALVGLRPETDRGTLRLLHEGRLAVSATHGSLGTSISPSGQEGCQ